MLNVFTRCVTLWGSSMLFGDCYMRIANLGSRGLRSDGVSNSLELHNSANDCLRLAQFHYSSSSPILNLEASNRPYPS